jgi:hypothetical protein
MNKLSPHSQIIHLEGIADWMDSRFTVPGTKYKFGLDPVMGLIPGVGDTVSLAVSTYIYAKITDHDVPKHLRMKMAGNIFVDWLIGLIPFAGDLFDIGWKANRRNIKILKEHLDKKLGVIDV